MPKSFERELAETTAEVRGLLEDLQRLGIGDLVAAEPPAELPLCPPGLQGTDGAGMACRGETLEDIRSELENCGRCPLCSGRSNIVFGTGHPSARLVLVGEAPGREEDRQGEPFVGEAGRLLDRILFAMGMERREVYICNVVKCRPPGNRDPHPDEIAACEPYLKRQLAAIAPDVIVALGRFAAQTLLGEATPVSRLRGRWRQYQGIPLMPTYHPAYLLRNPAGKREVWEDMKMVMQRLREGGKGR